MISMGFKITKDNVHLTEYEKSWSKVGKSYECTCHCAKDSSVKFAEGKYKFRLQDDDGNVFYYGVSDHDSCFCPLDWSQPLWGCTEIQYRDEKTKQYQTL